ncbi:MAG: Wzz/FepE/Etk N-terminal domain-containing protein [Nitrospiraceae bacterium]|nr:Wzz/FepE/Etk N-terminal domain-containing protein [Nitrospiraceae bacterium]
MTEELHDEEINLLEYWDVLWRRKVMIIALCTVSVTATMIMSLLAPKYYKSETVVMASASDSGGLGAALSSMPLVGALTGAGIATPSDKVMVLLNSRTMSEMVIRKFDLMRVFNEDKWDAAKGAWKDPEKPPLMEDTVKLLNKSVVKINNNKKDGSITISVEWKDPQLAADIANYYISALAGLMNDKAINTTIQVVDRAIPAERKSKPIIRKNMMIAGFLSLFVGVFIAFFLDYLAKQKKQSA